MQLDFLALYRSDEEDNNRKGIKIRIIEEEEERHVGDKESSGKLLRKLPISPRVGFLHGVRSGGYELNTRTRANEVTL